MGSGLLLNCLHTTNRYEDNRSEIVNVSVMNSPTHKTYDTHVLKLLNRLDEARSQYDQSIARNELARAEDHLEQMRATARALDQWRFQENKCY